MIKDRRLLLMACSRRKRPDSGPMPAIDRYDGPAFRVVRRYLRQSPTGASKLDVQILSAAYGLIPSTHSIVDYDRKMTPARAAELHDQVQGQLSHLLDAGYGSLCLSMSKTYLLAMGSCVAQAPPETKVTLTKGPQGAKLAQLKRWLWQDVPDGSGSNQPKAEPRGQAVIRGVEIRMTPLQVLDVARQALAWGRGNPSNYQSWYVLVDEQRVAPKWLVSQLTGLPTTCFHSQEARRVCQQLGVEVCFKEVR